MKNSFPAAKLKRLKDTYGGDGKKSPAAGTKDGEGIADNRNFRLSILYSATILVLATVSARSVNNMVATSLPFLAKYSFSFSNVMVGLISAAMNISTFVVTSYLNPKLQSSTRRKVFIASTGIIPVMMFFYYLSTPLIVWPIAVLSGLAFGFIFPNIITSATLHHDHIVQMRLLAIYSLSLSLSLVMGPSIETWLLTFMSYKQIFLPFLGISLIGFAVSPFIRFPDIKREVRGRSALRNNGLITSILAITIYNVPFAAITSFLVIFAVDRFSVSSSTAYSVFIYFFMTSFASRLLMAVRPFRSIFLPLLASAVITIVGLVLIPLTPSFLYFVILMAIVGIPHGTIFPMASMLVARGTRPEERNVANSYFLAYNNVLFIVIPVIFGGLSSKAGFTVSFIILGISALLSTALLMTKYRSSRELFTR